MYKACHDLKSGKLKFNYAGVPSQTNQSSLEK